MGQGLHRSQFQDLRIRSGSRGEFADWTRLGKTRGEAIQFIYHGREKRLDEVAGRPSAGTAPGGTSR